MEKKVCSKCKEEKELSDYPIHGYKKNGEVKLRGVCKVCYNISKKKNYDKYYNENKDSINKRRVERRKINKDSVNKYKKEWTIRNKEHVNEYNKKWWEENSDKTYFKQSKKWEDLNEKEREDKRKYKRKYQNKKYKDDILYRLKCNITSNILQSFRLKGYTKKSRTYKILGCTYDEFKLHIELQFKEWMNWDNYGKYNGEEKYGWDLDHIIPLSSGKCEEDIIRLNHHSNIQPLCSYINRYVKRDKIEKGISNVFDIVV
jgi:hypothetical protein